MKPPLATFWECTACGFRYVETPARGRGRLCPRCGAPAKTAARVPAPPRETAPAGERRPLPHPTVALLLDNFRSAYNVGAAFRTADAAGVAHVYLAGISPTPAHPGVQKTALGAETWVPWSSHANGVTLASHLKSEGWALWALETAPEASLLPLRNRLLPEKLVLVCGNEVAGVDPDLLALADAIVALPMHGHKHSLNVASALAAALYLLRC